MGKKLREIKSLAQGHTTRKQLSQDRTLEATLLPTRIYTAFYFKPMRRCQPTPRLSHSLSSYKLMPFMD